MTSVIHDFTKLSAGSFTLYTDTNMMDGHREGRTLSGRRGSGSYEMYPEHRISPGESNNRKSPNLGQAPGCPGSLPESTQKVEELSRQLTDVSQLLSDSKVRESKMLQTIADLQSQGQEARQVNQQAYGMPNTSQQEYGLQGNQGNSAQEMHKIWRETLHQTPPATQGSEIHGRDNPPRPHKSVAHSYVNLGGSVCPPGDDPVEENVKDGHIKHLQRQVTMLQANLYRAEEYRTKCSELMKERDRAIDEIRIKATHLSNAREENEQLKRHTEKLNSDLIQTQQQLRQTCMELEAEKRSSLSRTSQESSRQRMSGVSAGSSDSGMSGRVSGGASDHSCNSSCSTELEHLHQVVDALKKTVLDQRKFLITKKESSTQINGNPHREAMSVMSKSSSAALGSDPRVPVGFRPDQFGENALHQHAGQGDSNYGRQRPLPPRAADRNPMQENGNAFEANSVFDLHRQGFTVDKVPSQSLHSKDSGISTGRLPSSTSSSTSTSVSSASLMSPTKKNVVRTSSSNNGVQTPPHPALTRKVSHSETFGRRPIAEHGINVSQNGSRSATIATAASQQSPSPGLQEKSAASDWPQAISNRISFPNTSDATAKPRPLEPVPSGLSRQQFVTNPRAGTPYETAVLPPDSEQSSRRPDINQNSNFLTHPVSHAHDTHQQPTIYRPPVVHSDNTLRVINPDLMGGSRITTSSGSSDGRFFTSENRTAGYQEQVLLPQSPRAREMPPPTSESQTPPLNSDRVCPVCNRDYSHVSMEDFQTHVFECFDEDGPETMKPEEPAERACPMCNKKFRGDLPQHEFEAHVHSHFGEEQFEVLHRD